MTRSLPEEVPVAITFNGTTLAVMMATPDDIADFAHGFALTEGAIGAPGEIESFEIVEGTAGDRGAVLAGGGARRSAREPAPEDGGAGRLRALRDRTRSTRLFGNSRASAPI